MFWLAGVSFDASSNGWRRLTKLLRASREFLGETLLLPSQLTMDGLAEAENVSVLLVGGVIGVALDGRSDGEASSVKGVSSTYPHEHDYITFSPRGAVGR